MVDTKIKLDRDKIINIAFTEWGKTAFHNLSLTSISSKLKISKAALYKYFHNKEELIFEMSKVVQNDIININSESVDIENYISKNVDFFIKNHNKLFFYTIVFSNNKQNLISLKRELNKLNFLFDRKLIVFINTSILFYLSFYFFHKFYDNKKFIFRKITISEIDLKEIKSIILDLINNGILAKNDNIEIDFEKIENLTTILEKDLPIKSELFTKISNTIAKYGLWDTTTDKISKEICIPKSTLYYYFKSKKEILQKTMFEEFTGIKDLYLSKISQFNNFFEKLYALINTSYTHLMHDLNHLKIINWFHYQNIDIKDSKEVLLQIYKFVLLEINNGNIKKVTKEDIFPIIYTNIHIVKEVIINKLFDKHLDKNNIRNLYRLILKGVNGGT